MDALQSHSVTALDSCASEKILHSKRLVLRKSAIKQAFKLGRLEVGTFEGESAVSRSQLMLVLMVSSVNVVVFLFGCGLVWNPRAPWVGCLLILLGEPDP